MASVAEDEGFAPPGSHDMHPGGFGLASLVVEIGEFSDVMNLAVLRPSTNLTRIRKEPFNQLVIVRDTHCWCWFRQNSLFLPSERNSPKACD